MSNVTVRDCVFEGNTGRLGGGLCSITESEVIVQDCQFISNSAENGGGLGSYESGFTLIDCNIISNLIISPGICYIHPIATYSEGFI